MVNQIEKVSAHLPVKKKYQPIASDYGMNIIRCKVVLYFSRMTKWIFFFMIGNQVIFNQDQMVNQVESTKWLIK